MNFLIFLHFVFIFSPQLGPSCWRNPALLFHSLNEHYKRKCASFTVTKSTLKIVPIISPGKTLDSWKLWWLMVTAKSLKALANKRQGAQSEERCLDFSTGQNQHTFTSCTFSGGGLGWWGPLAMFTMLFRSDRRLCRSLSWSFFRCFLDINIKCLLLLLFISAAQP